LRAKFIFDASTTGAAQAGRPSQGCSVTSLTKERAASAERRITHQLSGKALKIYLGGEETQRHNKHGYAITRTTRRTNEPRDH
jgi:hypothetical protein